MIILHGVEPRRYFATPEQFAAVVVVDSHLEEILVGYDNIDQLLKPNLLLLRRRKRKLKLRKLKRVD